MTKDIVTKKSFSVVDAHELDQRIPRNLIIMMEGKPFVLKAGLEWKANELFGLGKWSLETEIVRHEPEKKYALVKARVKYNGSVYENYGEASVENVLNSRMHKYILHMAVTRAEARALRVATACGFTAVEEMDDNTAVNASVVNNESTAWLDDGQKETLEEKKTNGHMTSSDINAAYTDRLCESCGERVSDRVRDYSKPKYGKVYCYNCQKKNVVLGEQVVENVASA